MRAAPAALAVVVCLLAAAALPASAPAAPYLLYSCKAPDGSPAPTDGWSGSPSTRGPRVLYQDQCASGGPLRGVVDETKEHPRGTSIGFSFAAPPDVRLTGYDLSRRVALDPALRNADNTVRAAFDYSLFRGDFLDFKTPESQRELCYSSGAKPENGRPAAECTSLDGVFAEAGADVDDLFFFADCSMRFGDCPVGLGGLIELRAARLTLEDGFAPKLEGTPGGSLLDTSGPQSGRRELSFSASDRGAGVSQATLEIDGKPVDERRFADTPGACREPYLRRVPCPQRVSESFSVDTAALQDGRHEVRLIVTDATRVNRVAFGPVAIETANRSAPAPPGGNESPSCLDAPPVRVTGRPGRSTTGFGDRPAFLGSVRNAGGGPVAGATVRVLSGNRTLATAVTKADGSYRARIPAGPNRSLNAVVAVPGGLACARTALLKVRAGVTLALSRRRVGLGRRIGFAGRVEGASRPRKGKLVVLQVRDRQGWQVLKVVRTDSRGRYRYTYRFRRSRGTFTYRFRAQVPRQRDHPYVLGYSRVRRLTVVGR